MSSTLTLPANSIAISLRTAANTSVVFENIPDAIACIQAALGVSVKDLADILRVQSHTIYAWIAEQEEPLRNDFERLTTINRIAKHWNTLCRYSARKALKTPLENGQTLFEMLQEENLSEAEIKRLLPKAAELVNREYASINARRPTKHDSSMDFEIEIHTPVVFFPNDNDE